LKNTGVKKFTFHNYPNTALTRRARQGINVDVAMRASGHSSVQMHKRYVDLQREDSEKAFGVRVGNGNGNCYRTEDGQP